jgi:hypothetical protein
MNIVVDPKGKLPVTLKLTETKMLTDETGRKLVGSLDAIDVKRPEQSLRFDPEGVRLGREGTIFISDEYGPVLAEFNPQGKRIRNFPIPARFLPTKPGKTPADELPPLNTTGRVPNRGMEGLAISPDGTMLYGIMQSPLIQDGALDKDNARVGLNCRLLELDTVTKKSREFVYPLEDKGNGLSEILAINNQEFLVLERDSKGGKDAAFKKIYHINLAGATDVSAVAALPASELPSSIQPVKKTLFLDLLDKKFAIAGDECPEKFEGLAFGPDLPDGRRLLLVSADNDFIAEQPLRIYAFAIDPKQLPGFVPQQFSGR